MKTTKDDKLTLLFYLYNRQLGGIADCLRHMQSLKQGVEYSAEEQRAWVSHMQSELADLHELIKKTCGVLGIDFHYTAVLGTVRDIEKKEGYLKRHPGADWV